MPTLSGVTTKLSPFLVHPFHSCIRCIPSTLHRYGYSWWLEVGCSCSQHPLCGRRPCYNRRCLYRRRWRAGCLNNASLQGPISSGVLMVAEKSDTSAIRRIRYTVQCCFYTSNFPRQPGPPRGFGGPKDKYKKVGPRNMECARKVYTINGVRSWNKSSVYDACSIPRGCTISLSMMTHC